MIRDLVRHSAVYTVATLLTRAMVFVWLLVLPSFLDNEQYGFLGLLTTLASVFAILCTLEISQSLARYTPAGDEAALPRLVSTGWQFALGGTVIAAVALLLASPSLAQAGLGGTRFLPSLQIGIVWLALNALFVVLQSQLRWEFRARSFLIASAIFAVASILLSVGFAAGFADPLTGVMTGQAIAAAIALAYCLMALWPHLWSRFDPLWLRRLLAFSLPLVPASLAMFACTYANRLIIADTLGLADVGLFTWANQLSSIPAILVAGIQSAISPLVIRHRDDPETPARLARSFELVFAAGLLICAALAIGSPLLIALLGYDQFAAAPMLIALMAPGLLLLPLYVFFPGFAIAKRTGLQLIVSLIGGASVFATYPLIAAFGVAGAAIGTLMTGIIFFGVWVLLSAPHFAVPVRWGRIAIFAIVVAAGLSAWVLATSAGNALFIGAGALLAMSLASIALGLVRIADLGTLVAGLRR